MTDRRWSLPAALGIGERPELVAIVGAGGKSSLMFALAAVLPGRVVMTTTTRIFAAQTKHAPAVVHADDLAPLAEALAAHGRCLVIGRVEGDKALGVAPALPTRLLARDDVDYVLVEADGSRMRPIKAPATHEPVIPPTTTLLVPMAGLDALEGMLEDVAHRPEQIEAIMNDESGIMNEEGAWVVDGRLTAAGLAGVLAHPRGGLKDVPAGARVVPFLNKADTAERLTAAREAAALLLREPRVQRVLIGALRSEHPVREVWRRVAAVVLAAGESRRMGANKLLLPWGDATVLERTLSHVAASGVSSILAVVGHQRELTEPLAGRYGPIIYNGDYTDGMLSSVKAAVRAFPPTVEAALIMLGDQPLVGPDIIDALLGAYAANPHGLIAPVHHGRRGNPVIIDRRHFAELLALPAESAPRALLQRHPDDLLLVEVGSDAILHDLDRPEDYERLRLR
ncbi:MAG TPA: selenium cofactor biosynthesis protein YqeC [Promineifilum sp.]|nr:selenium cofactor biosynthesis protein YqeC [Promineifilum sp.]HRO91623.1 selenium cofactor biosynthesis protein YqeC [Promineifilum sp.]HRQ13296.1 selenium cofactor biosynthesis protein YqeC [Promineifilum sp.]